MASCDVLTDQEDDAQHRSFTSLLEEGPPPNLRAPAAASSSTPGSAETVSGANAMDSLRRGLIGRLEAFTTPFGARPLVYADWTASGRAHASVEDFVRKEVLPFYGNTHTTTSISGAQSTCFRHEARQMVAEAVNAKVTGKAADDVVLFCGSGTTAAIAKIVAILGLNTPMQADAGSSAAEEAAAGSADDVSGDEAAAAIMPLPPPPRRPVVLVGPMEHHSNLLPWRESQALVVAVRPDPAKGGRLDVAHLASLLKLHAGAPLVVGSFSAASNVTGLVEEVDAVTVLLHTHGALSFWDYASAAPYLAMDMNPSDELARKDAIFFSPHKFVGGVNTPGVLVLKKRLLANAVPSQPGGGTVFYVTDDHHRYLSNREEREEGGTPDIVGAVRVALCLRLKRLAGGHAAVSQSHGDRLARAVAAMRALAPRLVLLDDTAPGSDLTHAITDPAKRLPIFSFLIRWQDTHSTASGGGSGGRFLHYNFVGALLNDLFGVQCRGGCQCAGPYSQRLLGLDPPSSLSIERSLLEEKAEVLRPGYSRLSLPYAMSCAEVDYVLQAVAFVAERGWLFLPQYRLTALTGECKHWSRATRFPERKWLSQFSLTDSTIGSAQPAGATEVSAEVVTESAVASGCGLGSASEEALRQRFAEYLAEAHALADAVEGGRAGQGLQGGRLATGLCHDATLGLSDAALGMRWFALPSEASSAIAGGLASAGKAAVKAGGKNVLGEGAPAARCVSLYLSSLPLGPVQPPAMRLDPPQQAAREARAAAAEAQAAAEAAAGAQRLSQWPVKVGRSGKTKYPSRPAERHSEISLEPTVPLWADPVATQKIVSGKATRTAAQSAVAASGVLLRPHAAAPTAEGDAGIYAGGDGGAAPIELGSMVALQAAVVVIPKKMPVPPKKMMRAIGQAIRDWKMVEEGDRLVVGLSGGKDSLTLLFALLDLQRRAPVKFTVCAATVDPMTPSFDPSPLKAYLEALGITYHYLANPIVDRAASGQLSGDSLCAFCSRMKRGLLYGCCRDNGYNKLVLGQHLDDLAESFIMSTLHNGQVRTMKANYLIEAGDVSVIRPLVYVREHQTKDFAVHAKLPIINENCPACFEQPKERHRVKKMLAREEALAPEIFPNLRQAMIPLMGEGVYPYMDLVRHAVGLNQASDMRTQRSQAGQANGHGQAKQKGKVCGSDFGESPNAPSAMTAESLKWGSSCLAVLPDEWVEEEANRRKRARTSTGAHATAAWAAGDRSVEVIDDDEGGGAAAVGGVVSSVACSESAGPFRVAMPEQKVQLCGTGKCEMFD